jgi:signal peptidase II
MSDQVRSNNPLAGPWSANQRIGFVALAIFLSDQLTKAVVLKLLDLHEERVVLDGFFKFVHWGNTGAAWSMFRHNNGILAGISAVAVVALWLFRRHFEAHRPAGQLALGLLFGGITGNLLDRLLPSRQHVIDFLYFYVNPRAGGEIGFPAFNIADAAICTGVGLLILLSWRTPSPSPAASSTPASGGK